MERIIKVVRRVAAGMAVVVAVVWTGQAATVTNVRGVQREGSKLVDIYYDLSSTDGGRYSVAVEITGRTSEVTASTFSGDVGDGILPGINRHIVWDAVTDWSGNKGDVKATITATRMDQVPRSRVQLWANGPFWATTNIGAEKPEDHGYYFWWGDTVGYYRWNNAVWLPNDSSSSNFSFNKANTPTYGKDNDTLQGEGWITADEVLAPEHDAAHVHWGGRWRMPTDQEFSDLGTYCDWTLMTTNGVYGYEIRGRGNYASNSIFLPAGTGLGDGTSLYGPNSYGGYWASVPSLNDSCTAGGRDFNVGSVSWRTFERCFGRSVRPVQGCTE